jgi:hypothetical protein
MELCLTVAAHEACHTVTSLKLDAANAVWNHLGEDFKLKAYTPYLELRIFFEHRGRWFAAMPVGTAWVIDIANVEGVWVHEDTEDAIEGAGIAYTAVAAAARAAATVEGQVEGFEIGGVAFRAVRDRGGLIQVSHLCHDEPEPDDGEPGFGSM